MNTTQQLLNACLAAEPVLQDMQRIVRSRNTGTEEINALILVKAAIAAASRGTCESEECPYQGQQRAKSCTCSKDGQDV